MSAAIEQLIADFPELGIKRDVSFKTYTTLMAGGNAAYLADIHSVDVFAKAAAEVQKRKNVSTYDDNTTQSAIQLLLAVADASQGGREPRDARQKRLSVAVKM